MAKAESSMDKLSVHLVTWNVAAQFPGATTNLSSLLQEERPDLLFFGLQEVKSQPQNIITDTILAGEDPWSASFRSDLAPLGYVKVKSVRLLGLVLSLFCLEKHLSHLRGIESQYTRLGIGGYWGNKGAVSIRLQLYGAKVVVLNSHFAAHQEFNEFRLENYNTVLGSHLYSTKDTEMILYHDYVFWMGDLNFRLQSEHLEFEEVNALVSRNEFSKLLSEDQLTIARKEGTAFSELNENLPTFPPTFKYKIGSTSEFDRKRLPAWTDRILFKANKANYENFSLSLHQHNYSSHPDFCESDHKPVTSAFSISVFSPQQASSLLLPLFNPIVKFVEAGPYFCNEEISILYQVKIEERRYLKSWDWIGIYRMDTNNLEDHHAYTWASTTLVRNSVYEVLLDESVFPSSGDFRLVFFSVGSRDILGVSKPFRVNYREWFKGPGNNTKHVELAAEAKEKEL